jgi:hypothetical protein
MRKVGASNAAVLFALATLLLPGRSARADEEPALFGQQGQVVVGLPRLVPLVALDAARAPGSSDASTGTTMSYGSVSGQNMVDQPRLSLGWVAAPRLEVGTDVTGIATLGGSPAAGDAPQVSLFGFAPHLGYLAPIRDALCLWLRAGAAYYVLGEKGVDASPGGSTAWSFTWRQLDVDLEAHMAVTALPHIAITAGIVAELPVVGYLDEPRSGGLPSIDGSASWLHVGIVGGLLVYL